jgi:hypothetical protein
MLRSLQMLIVLLVVQCCLFGDQEVQGPYLYCQKKWGELKWEGLKIQVLKLRAEQFPPGKTYTLFIRNCDGSETQVFNYTANKKGHLIIDIDKELKQGAPFAVTPLRKGEKVSYCMYSPDRSEKITTSIIPFPIEASTDFTTVSLELLDPKGEAFVCVGKGFTPGETVQVICTCGDQVIQEVLSIDGSGSFNYLLNPSVKDQETGTAKVTVKRQNEQISVPFVWGRQAQEFVGAICLQIN